MHPEQKQTIREALTVLAATHAIVVEQIERVIAVLSLALEAEELAMTGRCRQANRAEDRPATDRGTLAVTWQGKTCFLGNTLLFLFFERIARSPNRYVSHVDLLDDVWGGHREPATIRGVAKRLRDRLVEEGLAELAQSIDGSVAGHYGLILV